MSETVEAAQGIGNAFPRSRALYVSAAPTAEDIETTLATAAAVLMDMAGQ